MRVGEARAAEVGHRVGLAPDDVVQDPEAGVLQQRADAEDVVVAADHPDGAVVLQDAARLGQPFAGEIVIGREAVELVPIVVAGIDLAALGRETGRRPAGDCRAGRRRSCRPTCREAAPSRRCNRPRGWCRAEAPSARVLRGRERPRRLRYRHDHVHGEAILRSTDPR